MSEPKIDKVKAGWAALGEGWAVHAPTREAAIEKYKERERFYRELIARPPWYHNPENPNRTKTDD